MKYYVKTENQVKAANKAQAQIQSLQPDFNGILFANVRRYMQLRTTKQLTVNRVLILIRERMNELPLKPQLNIPVVNNRIYLAILNITSWVGLCGDAEHVYGHLILSEKKEVNIDNIEDWNVKYLGERIELRRPLTLELAKELDKKDGHKTNQRHFITCSEDPEFTKENPDYGTTNRFNTFEEVVNVGIEIWKELNIDCPFISLFEGQKYTANKYEPSTTVVLQYGC